jgi:3-isopropylmalate/(R)-2-methylmalate dehydratase large subunit
MALAKTLFEKIWDRHTILQQSDGSTLLHIARHLVHDGSHAGFKTLRERGLKLRRPDCTFGSPDHYVPTTTRDMATIKEEGRRNVVTSMNANAKEFGMTMFALDDIRQGIIHVVGPEQGISQPGLVIVCGDSHTATHGALGALAFGIGASEVTHVMATQTLWQTKPKSMRITVTGQLGAGVTAKDVILAIIAKIGAAGGTGHVIEYAGSAITGLSMEGRMTLCNMSIEAGARAGMVAPDEKTYAYIKGRPYAPSGQAWDEAMIYWKSLPTDAGAKFDQEIELNGSEIIPMMTWGTSPEEAGPINGVVPDPADIKDLEKREALQQSLDYMGLKPGMPFTDIRVDKVFIGSCTNSRIEDIRAAAAVVKGKKAKIWAMVVPGSGLIKAQAEAEGLDKIFLDAGFEWRYAGCSMCVGMNGDLLNEGERSASTSNRNFVGRQGRGARTHLVSPAMAAAAAIYGHFVDVRSLNQGHAQ